MTQTIAPILRRTITDVPAMPVLPEGFSYILTDADFSTADNPREMLMDVISTMSVMYDAEFCDSPFATAIYPVFRHGTEISPTASPDPKAQESDLIGFELREGEDLRPLALNVALLSALRVDDKPDAYGYAKAYADHLKEKRKEQGA